MVNNPPAGFPRITPYLLYEDADAAVAFLTEAFGFTVLEQMKNDDGRTEHAELKLLDGMVMLGCPGPDYQGPAKSGGSHVHVYVYVDDVDAHYEHAKGAGAKIARDIADQFYGDRNYGAVDAEGHHWFFAQHLRDA
ncbi:MAG: VOC family protein [Planctomycetota bacterium]|jgi:uncharacterized glyoxalase superfamily protein PhnB